MNFEDNSFVEQWGGVPIYKSNNCKLINDYVKNQCISICNEKKETCWFSKEKNVLGNLNDFYHIKTFINFNLQHFVKKVYSIKQNVYISHSFVTIKKNGDFHHPHSHTNSFISGVFYVQCAENDQIKFHTSVPHIFKGFENLNFDILNHNSFNSPTFIYDIEPGDLFIFPSHIRHSVEVNKSNVDRIAISFNSFFTGNFGEDIYCGDLSI